MRINQKELELFEIGLYKKWGDLSEFMGSLPHHFPVIVRVSASKFYPWLGYNDQS